MVARSVFVSYARSDSQLVLPDVELLRAGGVRVFVDVHNIGYGERWRAVLTRAIDACERVIVFWSAAAKASNWVEREWRMAIERGKKIVPTLLDDTPLPTELAEFQALTRFPLKVVLSTKRRKFEAPAEGPSGAPASRRASGKRTNPSGAQGSAPASPKNVFVSYRRDDSEATAALLYRELTSRPEFADVFMDNDDIGYGDDFVVAIDGALREADVVLVIVGPKWAEMLQARLRGDDWVRHEVATALRLREADRPSGRPALRVLPVLIDGAAPPAERMLPADLAPLAHLSMLNFDARALKASINTLLGALHGDDFEMKVRRLQEERRRFEEEPLRHEMERRRLKWSLISVLRAGIVVLAGGGAALWLSSRLGKLAPGIPDPSPAASASPSPTLPVPQGTASMLGEHLFVWLALVGLAVIVLILVIQRRERVLRQAVSKLIREPQRVTVGDMQEPGTGSAPSGDDGSQSSVVAARSAEASALVEAVFSV